MINMSKREREIVLKGIIGRLNDGWDFAFVQGNAGENLSEIENQLIIDILMEYVVGGDENV